MLLAKKSANIKGNFGRKQIKSAQKNNTKRQNGNMALTLKRGKIMISFQREKKRWGAEDECTTYVASRDLNGCIGANNKVSM